MVKRRMVLLIVIGICILLNGCGIFHLRGTIPNYEEQIYTPSTTVRKVILQDEDVLVRLCNSETDELYLSYYEADDGSERYKIIQDEEILTVTKESEANQGIFIFGDQYSSDSYKEVKLTVFIPNDYEGDVSFHNATITRKLSCRTQDGNVEGILNRNESQYNINIKTISGNMGVSFD